MLVSGRMPVDPQETIAAISRALPPGLTVREHRPADLAAEVDFQNRYGRPAERRALADIALNAGLRGDEPAGVAFAQGRGYVAMTSSVSRSQT